MVLDAKYKRLSGYEKVAQVDNSDIDQVITYMTALHVDRGGFIAPLEQPQVKVPTSPLKGKVATLSIFGIEISRTTKSYVDFCHDMQQLETTFIKSLNL